MKIWVTMNTVRRFRCYNCWKTFDVPMDAIMVGQWNGLCPHCGSSWNEKIQDFNHNDPKFRKREETRDGGIGRKII